MSDEKKGSMRQVVEALMPDGPIWHAIPNQDLAKFYKGLGDSAESVITYLNTLADSRNPFKTPFLQSLEAEFGVLANTKLSEYDRRLQLAAVMFQRRGTGSDSNLELRLQAAGFDAYVYRNNPIQDPGRYVGLNYQTQLAGGTAYIGDPSARIGYNQANGFLLVNGPNYYRKQQGYDAQIGGPLAHLGSPEASLGFYADEDVQDEIVYTVPTERKYWPSIFFVGGPTSGWVPLDDYDMELSGVSHWPPGSSATITQKDTEVHNSGVQSLRITSDNTADQEVDIDASDPDYDMILVVSEDGDTAGLENLVSGENGGSYDGIISNTIAASGRAAYVCDTSVVRWDSGAVAGRYPSDITAGAWLDIDIVAVRQTLFAFEAPESVSYYTVFIDEYRQIGFEDKNGVETMTGAYLPTRLALLGFSMVSGVVQMYLDGVPIGGTFTPAVDATQALTMISDTGYIASGTVSYPFIASVGKNASWWVQQNALLGALGAQEESGAYTDRAVTPVPIPAVPGVHNIVTYPIVDGVSPSTMLDGRDGANPWLALAGNDAEETGNYGNAPQYGKFGEYPTDRSTAYSNGGYHSAETGSTPNADVLINAIFKSPTNIAGKQTIYANVNDGVTLGAKTRGYRSATDNNPYVIDGVSPSIDYRGDGAGPLQWAGIAGPLLDYQVGDYSQIPSAFSNPADVGVAADYGCDLPVYPDYSKDFSILGAESALFEIVWWEDGGPGAGVIAWTSSYTGTGWIFNSRYDTPGVYSLKLLQPGSGEVECFTPQVAANTIHVVHGIVDRYTGTLTLVLDGAVVDTQDMSGVGDILATLGFDLGGDNTGTGGDSRIVRISLWKKEGLYVTPALAADRYQRMAGGYGYRNDSGPSPRNTLRQYPAYTDIYDATSDVVTTSRCPIGWPRIARRKYGSDTIEGYLSEAETTNYTARGVDIGAWDTSALAALSEGHLASDYSVRAVGLVADATSSAHYCEYGYLTGGLHVPAGDVVVYGDFAPGDQPMVRLSLIDPDAPAYIRVNLETCEVDSTSLATALPCYRLPNGMVRVGMLRTTTVSGVPRVRIYSSTPAGSDIFVGDGVTVNTYAHNINVMSASDYLSPVDTDGTTATRLADRLQYGISSAVADSTVMSISCDTAFAGTGGIRTVWSVSDVTTPIPLVDLIISESDVLQLRIGGIVQSSAAITPNTVHTIRANIETGNAYFVLDGVKSAVALGAVVPAGKDYIGVGCGNFWAVGGSDNQLNGIVSNLEVNKRPENTAYPVGIEIATTQASPGIPASITADIYDISGDRRTLEGPASIDPETWHSVTLAHSPAFGAELYLDAVQQDTNALTLGSFFPESEIKLGEYSNHQISFVADYRNVGWFNQLDQSAKVEHLSQLYHAGAETYRPQPVSCYLWGGGPGLANGIPAIYYQDPTDDRWYLGAIGYSNRDRLLREFVAPNGAKAVRLITKFAPEGSANFDDLDITDVTIAPAQIPAERWDEFLRIILKTKPLRSWAVVIAERA